MTNNEQGIRFQYQCRKKMNNLGSNFYCQSCQKHLHDFRECSIPQINAFILSQPAGSVCGIFNPHQIENAIYPNAKNRWFKRALHAACLTLGLSFLADKLWAQQSLSTAKPNDSIKTDNSKAIGNNVPLFGEVVEPMPYFKLNDDSAFARYVQSKLKKRYPFKGKVFVNFVIQPNGALSEVKILRGSGTPLDAQIINVIKHCPKWHFPAYDKHPHAASYTVPLSFE
jgi:TonB family protein